MGRRGVTALAAALCLLLSACAELPRSGDAPTSSGTSMPPTAGTLPPSPIGSAPGSTTVASPANRFEGVVATHGAVAVDGDIWVAVSGPPVAVVGGTECLVQIRRGAGLVRAVWLQGGPGPPAIDPPPTWLCSGRLSATVAAWRDAVWVSPSSACAVERVDPATADVVPHVLGASCQVTALADGGESLWAAVRQQDGSAALVAMDPAGTVTQRLPAPVAYRRLAVQPDRIYGVGDRRVLAVDRSTGESTDLGPGDDLVVDGDGVVTAVAGTCEVERGGVTCAPTTAVQIAKDGQRTEVAITPPRTPPTPPTTPSAGVAMVPPRFGTVDHRWWTLLGDPLRADSSPGTTWVPALLDDDAPGVIAVTADQLGAIRFPPLDPPVPLAAPSRNAGDVVLRFSPGPDVGGPVVVWVRRMGATGWLTSARPLHP